MQTALDVVQILNNLVKVAVLNEVVLQALQSVDLRRAFVGDRYGFVQHNLCGHFAPMFVRRISNEVPCFEFIVDQRPLATMRANTRQPFNFFAAFFADHMIFLLAVKILLHILTQIYFFV